MVNKVILVGNVGKEPEVKHLDSGVSVARLSLATNETYTDKSGKKVTQTEWHNIVIWRGLAEVVEKYVKSGHPLYIEGKLRYSTYEDKEGKKQYRTEIICDNLRMLGGKSDKQEVEAQEPTLPPTQDFNVNVPGDDLPF